ncbi:MAG: hypothetical protein C4517_14935 [Stygiobacter sp.]|nr:MAG: hypothetical protein C4517_14935 [Stygiobacter sp.]
MKKIAFLICMLVLVSCKEQIVSSDPVINDPGPLKKLSTQMPCGNDVYPSIGDNRIFGIEWCLEPGISEYSRSETCIIWSNLIQTPGGSIIRGDYPCDYNPIFDGPAATQMWLYRPYQSATQIYWTFVWCDWYRVQRKIGNGAWVEIASSNNSTGSGSLSTVDWISPTSELITYHIVTKIDGYENTSNEISFYY